jgi:hypothetical protein
MDDGLAMASLTTPLNGAVNFMMRKFVIGFLNGILLVLSKIRDDGIDGIERIIKNQGRRDKWHRAYYKKSGTKG